MTSLSKPRAGLTLENLEIRRNGNVLVRIDAHVDPGHTLTLMGPSGIGKSTVLSAIVGQLDPGFRATGRILLDGRDLSGIATEDRRVGLLFQDDLLFPHLSVGGNLAFGLARRHRGRSARRAACAQALSEVGLAGIADRDPATLSGGQKARVALLRVLLSEPRALLLDEPFARLDTALRVKVRRLVIERARRQRLPVVLVTHDASDAAASGGPVIDLTPRN